MHSIMFQSMAIKLQPFLLLVPPKAYKPPSVFASVSKLNRVSKYGSAANGKKEKEIKKRGSVIQT